MAHYFESLEREQSARHMNNYRLVVLLPLTTTSTALLTLPDLPDFQSNLTGGQNQSVMVIYTVDASVKLNQFNDFDEREQHHC